MSTVHLIADSTCDIPVGEANSLGVAIVPLRVIIGEEEFADGVDITPATLYARMRSSTVVPRTSQPTPAEFEAAFTAAGADGNPVVCTTISANMSGTFGSATQAREALGDRDIRVIDSRSVGPGHRQVVQALIAAAAEGADADRLVEVAAAVIATQRLVFTVESLEYLRRGGRIGGARALLGSMLNIKPILEVRDGTVEPADRVRTFPRALDRLVDEVSGSAGEWGGQAVATVTHADLAGPAVEIARRISEVVGHEVPALPVGPVIGCHGGPGAIGVAFHRPL